MSQQKSTGRSLEREVFWRGHVEAQSRSGESVRGYCRSQGLSEAGFYFWRRELARRARERGAAGASEGRTAPSKRTGRVRFAEVRLSSDLAQPCTLEVALVNGRRVAVRPGFDEETLARVVSALERAPGAQGR